MKRRQFIKLAGTSAIASALPWPAFSMQAKQWPPYSKAIVIDGLNVTFARDMSSLSNQQLATIQQSGLTAINATVPYPGSKFEKTNQRIAHVKEIIAKYPSHFRLIKTYNDVLLAKQLNQVGIIIGFQSTEMIDDKLERIAYFANQGCRYMQLTYNSQSQFGGGALSANNIGLTELGRQAIAEIEANHVLLDLSHSNSKTVAQAISVANKPLTISHTGCNALYQHPRNNDDNILRAVANNGGVIGIYLMPFLEGGEHEVTADTVVKHIKHAINVCGEDAVSIGSDQGILPIEDGPAYREKIRKEVEKRMAAGISAPGETPNRPPFIPQLNSARRMELIAWYLAKAGFGDRTIEKVIGHNLLSLYQRVWN